MRKWYRTPLVKAALTGTAIASAVVLSLSTVALLGYQGEGGVSSGEIWSFQLGEYEDSSAFSQRMQEAARRVLDQISAKRTVENEDGQYDPKRLVDVMEYQESGEITGKNESGLAYTMEAIEQMSGMTTSSEYNVVVCEKPDGTYDYYYMDEFEDLLRAGEWKIEIDGWEEEKDTHESGMMAEELLDMLESGWSLGDYYGTGARLQDADGETAYQNIWPFLCWERGEIAPDGAEDLLDAVSRMPEYNGKLSEITEAVASTVNTLGTRISVYRAGAEEWEEGNTNLSYLFVDKDAKRVYTNRAEFEDYEDAEANVESMKAGGGKYVVVESKLADFESNTETSASEWQLLVNAYGETDGEYIFVAAVDTEYPIQDIFYESRESYGELSAWLKLAGPGMILGGLLLLTALVWLTVIAGRRPEDEELHLNGFDRWKTALGAAAVIVPWLLLTAFVMSSWNGIGYQTYTPWTSGAHYTRAYYIFTLSRLDSAVIAFYVGLTMAFFLAGYLSLVRRIKGGTVWKNSVTRWVCKGIGQFWRYRSVTVRGILLLGGFVLIHWFVWLVNGRGLFVLIMLAADAAAAYFVIRTAIEKDRIRKGLREIASGNVDYQIPTDKMRGESLETAEMINNIGDGLNNAVEEAMKSERLKADLITNVSHDIKTPLTSIINYVDLLKRENLEDSKIQGYLEILEAKAQRLKTLTEDVVEASKVSSGNITLEMMDVNLVEMVNQTIGEFSEKLEAKDLTVIASLPEEPAIVHVDGRRMWRVLENLFNNVAKYAMPGTRVYADLKIKDGHVEFSLKNVSENPLNINAEELTERFIRGDVSRSTEGSGLGLSIARDLVEMQGGKFSLYVDGDLFKVMIEF